MCRCATPIFTLTLDADTIEDIINGLPNYMSVDMHWDHVSHASRQIAERLRTLNNSHLPRLVKDCEYISFKNGQYSLVFNTPHP